MNFTKFCKNQMNFTKFVKFIRFLRENESEVSWQLFVMCCVIIMMCFDTSKSSPGVNSLIFTKFCKIHLIFTKFVKCIWFLQENESKVSRQVFVVCWVIIMMCFDTSKRSLGVVCVNSLNFTKFCKIHLIFTKFCKIHMIFTKLSSEYLDDNL